MRASTILLLALFSYDISKADSGRILVSYALGSASHLQSMMPLIMKLVEAGHNITVFEVQQSHQRQIVLDARIARVTVNVKVRKSTEAKMADLLWNRDYSAAFMAIAAYFSLIANEQIFNNYAKELYTIMRGDFDLVMVDELFNDYGFAFAEHFHKNNGVPYVVFGPTITSTNHDYYMGSGRNWASTPPLAPRVPSFFDEKYAFTSFFTRMRGFVDAFFELILMFLYDWRWRRVVGERLGVKNFDNFEFIANSQLFLTDDLYHVGFTKSRLPNLLPIGAHCKNVAHSLDTRFLQFVEDNTSKGTIYVSFGTYVNWNLAPSAALQTLLSAFDALPDYRFVFAAYEGPKVNASSNVRMIKWAPQAEVLAHPRTKVFLTHGGIKSVREAICAEVPMLVMPMTFDESRLAHVVNYRGLGGTHNKRHLNTPDLVRDLTRLLRQNDAYKRRARRVRAAFVDRPMTDVHVGEFYVSRLIRLFQKRKARMYNGRIRLFRENRSTTIPFYEFIYMTHAFILAIICYYLTL